MPKGKSIARHEQEITASSFGSDNDNHELLNADQEEAPEAHTSTHDVASSSGMPQYRRGTFTVGSIHL
jgi:hypothetical protein